MADNKLTQNPKQAGIHHTKAPSAAGHSKLSFIRFQAHIFFGG